MIRAEDIPDEVARLADEAYYDTAADPRWSDEMLMKTAIAAAINAWEGAELNHRICSRGTEYLVLPLPQKEGDA